MLSVSDFNAMLNEMGQEVAWRRAYDCPCRDQHSGAAKPSCPSCLGKGVTWGSAVVGTVGVSGQKVQQQWAKLGMYESGDQVLTVPSDSPVYSAGGFDRLTMNNSSVPFSRVLGYTENSSLLDIGAISIERVFWLNSMNAAVEGAIPAIANDGTLTWTAIGVARFLATTPPVADVAIPAGTVIRVTGQTSGYVTQVDAVILAGGTSVDVAVTAQATGHAGDALINTVTHIDVPITDVTVNNPSAINSGAPPDATQFSVTGRRRPEYFVLQDFPQDRSHFHGITLPRRIVTRLLDLFAR